MEIPEKWGGAGRGYMSFTKPLWLSISWEMGIVSLAKALGMVKSMAGSPDRVHKLVMEEVLREAAEP